ncbi:MAG: efflux RND transporter periplasmic adaptor subunit [Gemmataceae bacterium]
MISVLGAGGYFAWSYRSLVWSSAASGQLPLTAKAVRGELVITVSDRGELDSINAVQVSNDLEGGGKLASILDEGKAVKKGDVVAKLDTDTFVKLKNDQEVKYQTADGKVKTTQSALNQAKFKAEGEISKAELALTLAKIDLNAYDDPEGEYKKDSEKLKGVVEENRKQLKEAEDDLAFTKGMVKDGFLPIEQLRAKDFAVLQRTYALASSEAELKVLEKFTRIRKLTELKAKAKEAELELKRTNETQKAAIESAEAELRSAESNLKSEKRELERIEKQIERCTITAPSDGIVVYSNQRFWDESSRIRPGATLFYRQEIFSLPDLSRMKVKLRIHESVIKKVEVGMPATLQLESLPNQLLHGKVIKIATIAQADGWRGAGVKQYETEVSIDDLPSDAGLKPGMTAEVKILVKTIKDTISVPISAVSEIDGKKVVYVVDNKTVSRRDVVVGDSNEQFFQILEGLSVGEEVALDARSRTSAELKSNTIEKDDKPKEKTQEKSKDVKAAKTPG